MENKKRQKVNKEEKVSTLTSLIKSDNDDLKIFFITRSGALKLGKCTFSI